MTPWLSVPLIGLGVLVILRVLDEVRQWFMQPWTGLDHDDEDALDSDGADG